MIKPFAQTDLVQWTTYAPDQQHKVILQCKGTAFSKSYKYRSKKSTKLKKIILEFHITFKQSDYVINHMVVEQAKDFLFTWKNSRLEDLFIALHKLPWDSYINYC